MIIQSALHYSGTSRGACRRCATCGREYAIPAQKGRPFIRCPQCRYDESQGGRLRSRRKEDTVDDGIRRRVGETCTFRCEPLPESDWRESAACFGMDQHVFFGPDEGFEKKGEQKRRIALAKSICAGCPVRSECLSYALAIKERCGIWGGLTGRERLVRLYGDSA